MSEYEAKKQEIAERSIQTLELLDKEKDVRDILIQHANLDNNGKTNLETVLEAFTQLATSAESEQVRSQTAIQYIKFLAKPVDEESSNPKGAMNLQININPIKGTTVIE